MPIKKHTVGDRTVEVWTQNDIHYAQDILCRGVIGQGDNDAQAIDNLVEALNCHHPYFAGSADTFRKI